jgi:hypothetical protein
MSYANLPSPHYREITQVNTYTTTHAGIKLARRVPYVGDTPNGSGDATGSLNDTLRRVSGMAPSSGGGEKSRALTLVIVVVVDCDTTECDAVVTNVAVVVGDVDTMPLATDVNDVNEVVEKPSGGGCSGRVAAAAATDAATMAAAARAAARAVAAAMLDDTPYEF